MQNSSKMPDTPENPLTSLRRMMSSVTPGGLRRMESSGSNLTLLKPVSAQTFTKQTSMSGAIRLPPGKLVIT
ncbi:Protein of unknown function [Pyronema omphalodes CBS 100304]|uniref:Uncharacterized protein n=1 Tax=Pyronema omphalodes (strain CBS 100304) TaxID=1076935 RepID=U4L7F2_PYROM|nr:Protein of unknown function [Pyronema omphalodes CBS 100304]